MKKNYTISLDIGTNSVGWAVLDDEFSLVRGKKIINETWKLEGQRKGKTKTKTSRTNLWGVRLFEEGETAKSTRLMRGNRRRIKRREERIDYLQEIFEKEILKKDQNFFRRLDESSLYLEDKKSETIKYPIFKLEKEEKEYHKKFPTIYHLRNYLMTHETDDIRLVYLAIHHILKHRGHFIQEGVKFDVNNINSMDNLIRLFDSINSYFSSGLDFEETEFRKKTKIFPIDKIPEIDDILCEKISKSEKSKKISNEILGYPKEISIFKAIVGNKVDIAGIFDKSEYSEKFMDELPTKIYFSKADFTEKLSQLESILEPEELEIILLARNVYESMVLVNILDNNPSLSLAMVKKYESHKRDLAIFKEFIRSNFGKNEYYKMFREEPEKIDNQKNVGGNYLGYIGFGKDKNKFSNKTKYTHATQENFYENVKSFLENKKDLNEDKTFSVKFRNENGVVVSEEEFLSKGFYKEILEKIELETFLTKQRTYKNGSIPYQIHEHELIEIIKCQSKMFPFLSEKAILDEDGLMTEEYKIQTLFKFKIPYYIGPLTEANNGEIGKRTSEKSRFAWMKKNYDEKITPWNFEKVVDKDASASEFIQRMTKTCTYLPDEKTLPQNSLLYQEFIVQQELVVSGFYDYGKNYFDSSTRQRLINDLWKKKRSVSKKRCSKMGL